MSDFQTSIAAEKDRLTTHRQALEAQIAGLRGAIASVDHELSAIAAYETTRKGKAPRGTKRDTVLTIIKDSAGITRAGIIEKLRAQGHEKPEAGLSNMLASLKKAAKIAAEDGKYAIPA